MFKINNKPELYKFLLNNIKETENKKIFKEAMLLLRKNKLFNNTKKLEKYLNDKINYKDTKEVFIFNLSSNIFEFSRKPS